MDNMLVGQRLKQARLNAGVSIETASEMSGIAKATILRIEHGRYKCLYFTTVAALCETYKADMHYISGL